VSGLRFFSFQEIFSGVENDLESASLLSGIVISGISIGLRVGVIISARCTVAGGGGVIAGGRGAVRGSRGSVAGLRGAIGRGSISRGGSAAGSEEVKTKEVHSKEREETKKDGLGDQIDGVARSSEVQFSRSLVVVQFGFSLNRIS